MEKDELIALVAEVLEVDGVELTDDLENRGWDSLSSLSFIAEVDERTGNVINAEDLADAKTVNDLLALVSN